MNHDEADSVNAADYQRSAIVLNPGALRLHVQADASSHWKMEFLSALKLSAGMS